METRASAESQVPFQAPPWCWCRRRDAMLNTRIPIVDHRGACAATGMATRSRPREDRFVINSELAATVLISSVNHLLAPREAYAPFLIFALNKSTQSRASFFGIM